MRMCVCMYVHNCMHVHVCSHLRSQVVYFKQPKLGLTQELFAYVCMYVYVCACMYVLENIRVHAWGGECMFLA